MRSEFRVLKVQTCQWGGASDCHPFAYGLTTIDLAISSYNGILNETKRDGTFQSVRNGGISSPCFHFHSFAGVDIASEEFQLVSLNVVLLALIRAVNGLSMGACSLFAEHVEKQIQHFGRTFRSLSMGSIDHTAQYVTICFVFRERHFGLFEDSLDVCERGDLMNVRFAGDICTVYSEHDYFIRLLEGSGFGRAEHIKDTGAILLIGLKDRRKLLLHLTRVGSLLAVQWTKDDSILTRTSAASLANLATEVRKLVQVAKITRADDFLKGLAASEKVLWRAEDDSALLRL
ncbi:hypothetical protein KCU91_g133, partial [Aureobasidium melanogenum]